MAYEIHITVNSADSDRAQQVADALRWKTSEIARDITLGDKNYFYLTRHTPSLEAAHAKLRFAVDSLRKVGVGVLREKIEHIIFDVRY